MRIAQLPLVPTEQALLYVLTLFLLVLLAGGTVGMIMTSLFCTTTANSAAVDGAFYGETMHCHVGPFASF